MTSGVSAAGALPAATQHFRRGADNGCMTRPRQVLPGTFYLITRSTAQQQFLMQPDKEGEAANAFIYCLVEAAIRFEIRSDDDDRAGEPSPYGVFDRHGRVSEFVEHFHKMFAKCQNRRLERGENFWSSDEVNVMELVDREMVMDKLVYTACNPVKDNLVERSLHWPGANGLPFLLENKPLKATRPKHYFRKAGKMPETVELNLVIPPELGNADEVRREIAELVTGVRGRGGRHPMVPVPPSVAPPATLVAPVAADWSPFTNNDPAATVVTPP